MKIVSLIGVVTSSLLFMSGCNSDDVNPEKILEKDSISITTLENNVVEYKKQDGIIHSYKYCPNDELRDMNDEKIGTYTIEDNKVKIIENVNVTYETDGKFEKGKEYNNSEIDEKETVVKISDTVCS